MKNNKDKVVRKKYMVGTSIKNIIEEPSTALAQNDIDIANAMYKGKSNPFVIGLDVLGNLTSQAGLALGGFGNIEGINPNLAKGLNTALPFITQGLQSLGNGGQVKPNIPVEVEGGEAGELPNGQLLSFSGPSHSEGGIPIDLPEGTEIYSKRIKIDGESMADRKLKRESLLARYTKKAKKLDDAISSNTLNRVRKVVDTQEEQDKKIQQLIHDMTTEVLNVGNQGMREKHWDGLTVGDEITDMEVLKRKSEYEALDDLFKIDGEISPNSTLFTPKVSLSNTYNPTNINYPFMSKNGRTPLPLPLAKSNIATKDIKIPTSLPNIDDKQSINKLYYDRKNNQNIENTNEESKIPPITGGDILNIGGNLFQGVAPYLNTLKQRATDTPNINAFKNYGEEGLNKIAKAKSFIRQNFDNRLKEIGLQRSDAIKRGRNSTGSINLMRALDTNADMAASKAENELYDSYATQMMDILSKEAQLENEQDRMVMQGEQARDLADRQDKDAYYTTKGQGLRDIGMTIANAGKQVNEIYGRNTQTNILNSMYENFGVNPVTGQVYGKVAKAMNLKDGDIPKPDAIEAFIKSGVDPRVKTKEDYYRLYGITDPNPMNIITTTGNKQSTSKESKSK